MNNFLFSPFAEQKYIVSQYNQKQEQNHSNEDSKNLPGSSGNASILSDLVSLKAKIAKKEKELEVLHKIETINSVTGIGEDMQGRSIANLTVIIQRARDIANSIGVFAGDLYCVISLDPNTTCLDHSERKTKVVYNSNFPSWDETIVFSPIVARCGFIRIQILQKSKFTSDDSLGHVKISLSALLEQNIVEDWYGIRLNNKERGQLLVKTRFKFSNILPLEYEIASLKKDYKEMDVTINSIDSKYSISSKLRRELIQTNKPRRFLISNKDPSFPNLKRTVDFADMDRSIDSNGSRYDEIDLDSNLNSDFLDEYGNLRRKRPRKEFIESILPNSRKRRKVEAQEIKSLERSFSDWLLPAESPSCYSAPFIPPKPADPTSNQFKENRNDKKESSSSFLVSWLLPSQEVSERNTNTKANSRTIKNEQAPSNSLFLGSNFLFATPKKNKDLSSTQTA